VDTMSTLWPFISKALVLKGEIKLRRNTGAFLRMFSARLAVRILNSSSLK